MSDLRHAQYRSLFRLAVLLAGDADAAEPRCWIPFTALHRLRKRPQTADDTLPHLRRLLVARSRRPGITSLGGQQAAVGRGRDCPGCTGTPQGAPRPEDSSATLALRTLPTSQREAIVLTFHLDLSPEQAAAACRVTLATLRRRLTEAGSALRAVLPSNP